MKAGVVAPDAGVGVNGKNGGEKLREKEEEEGNIEGSSFENEFLLRDAFEDPSSKNNNGNKIYKEHFIELKYLTGFRPEEKGSEEEEGEVAEAEELIEFTCFRHWR